MDSETIKKPPLLCSVRFMMTILIFFGYCLNYMQKIDMSISIVCMINHTAVRQLAKRPSLFTNHSIVDLSHNKSQQYHDMCVSHLAVTNLHDGEFVWSKPIQGLILSAYFYGYILMQIPGGWLAFKFGSTKVIAISMFIGSLFTLLIPVSAELHYMALIGCLFFTGLTHGAFWPSASGFWTYWAPISERSRLVGMASAGAKVGNIITLALGGVLCLHGLGSWRSIFYTFGSLGIVWSFIFYFLSNDSPMNHRFIGENEKQFILSDTKKAVETRSILQSNVPWKSILTSKACLSIFIGHFAHNWGNYLFLTQTPSFLKDVLKFDIKSNGFVSSVPYIFGSLATTLSSILSDYLIKSGKMSTRNARRLFTFAGTILPAGTILGLSFVDCQHIYLGVFLLTLGVSLDSIMNGAAYLININDIAGPYSSVVFGISNTIATIPGLISPYIAGVLTKHQSQHEWQEVFIICAIIYFVGGLLDIAFLSAEIQPWAIVKQSPTETNEPHGRNKVSPVEAEEEENDPSK